MSVVETGTTGRKMLSMIKGEDIITEHRLERNRSFGGEVRQSDESLRRMAQKAAEEKLPVFDYGISSIRIKNRAQGPTHSI
jgi:LPS O-antigen subunit length determinant protein (WzzB/FepE family)